MYLKDVSVESLLTKERARATVRRIVSSNPGHELTTLERSQLEAAVAAVETAALPFAPHQVADSCRHSEIQPAIDKFAVALPSEALAIAEKQQSLYR